MTPIERAARVLFTRDPGPYGDCIEWAIEQEFGWRDRGDDARAVIEAIREPSTDMRYKGCLNHPPADTAGIWHAMIDELLKE